MLLQGEAYQPQSPPEQLADQKNPVLPAGVALLVFYTVIWPVAVYLWDSKNLRRFPAPSLWGIPAWAGWSNAWLSVVIAKYARSIYVQAAHDKYGKVVRIQPNHLSFIEPAAVKDIYSFQAKMLKDGFYETFSGPDLQGHNFKTIVNTPDREEHSRKRRYISNAFAQRTVVTLEGLVNRGITHLLKQLDKIAAEGPPKWPGAPRDGFTNLYRWINLLAYDIVGEISFGYPLGLCEQGDDVMEALPFDGGPAYKTNIIDSFQGGNVYDCFFGVWPSMVHLLKRLTWWHHNSIKNKAFGDFVNMEVHKRLKRGGPSGYRDFMSYFLGNNKGEKLKLEYGEQWREASILLAGGTDTSTSLMSSTIYLLLKHPRCLEKLRQELDPVLEDTCAASYEQVCELPYLRAVIEETLRDRPPVGQGLPRVVPEGGATVAGYFIEGDSHSFPALASVR
jgi:cytochrome P450